MLKSRNMCYNGLMNNEHGWIAAALSKNTQINSKGDGCMKFIISGKNITVSEGLKTAVEDKLGKLERYFTPDTEVVVTLSVEKERQKN